MDMDATMAMETATSMDGHQHHMHGGMNMGSTHSMDDMHGGMDMHGMGHTMTFNFNLPLQVLFFEWNIVTKGQLAGSCVGVALLSIVYEGLKTLRQQIYMRKQFNGRPSKWRMFNGWHILQSILHMIQTTLGMFLMLIYMTFNVWLAISVSLGSGVGYLLFSWHRLGVSDQADHCI